MEADASNSESSRTFQLFGQPGSGSTPLGLIFRRGVEHVRGMNHDLFQSNAGTSECFPEALHPIGPHRGLVSIVLRRRGEDLECLHPRVAGAECGHADSAVEDGVTSQIPRHCYR
jgi:hypothetical protein